MQPDDEGGATELVRQLTRLRGLAAGSHLGDVHHAAATVRELADRIEANSTPIDRTAWESWGVPEHIASNPAMGTRSLVAPPLEPYAHPDGTVTAELSLGAEYQGPPGCVHGGIIALLFDEMLGLANAASKSVGMTVDLRVTYVSPTPLGANLRFEAHQHTIEGRKIRTGGTLHADGKLTSYVEGLFVTPKWLTAVAADRPVEG